MKKNTARLLSFLLTAVMLLSSLGLTAMAAASDAASIGNTGYSSVEAALKAAQTGDTVVLLRDSDCRKSRFYIEPWQEITLDLNGKTLIVQQMTVKGNLTVKDSTAKAQPSVAGPAYAVHYQTGKITDVPNAYDVGYVTVVVNQGGTLVLESGTIESTFNCAVYVQGNRAAADAGPENTKILVKGGYIKAPGYAIGNDGVGAQILVSGGAVESTNYAAISGSGDHRDGSYGGGTHIAVSGGTVIGRVSEEDRAKGYHACGIFHPQAGQLDITGGLVYAENGVGVQMSGGKLNMSGGTIVTTGNYAGQRCDATGETPIPLENCYGIQVDQKYGYYDGENVEAVISGNAAVVTEQGVPALDVNVDEHNTNPHRLIVNGGKFSNDVSAFLPEGVEGGFNQNGEFEVGKPAEHPDPQPPVENQSKTIQAGSSALQNPRKVEENQKIYYQPMSYVYLGTAGEAPIRWRVLNAHADSTGKADGVFLLSENLHGDTKNGDVPFDFSQPWSNVWEESDAKQWCQKFAQAHLGAAELAAVRKTTKTEPEVKLFNYTWTENSLKEDQLFFLSVQELEQYVANFNQGPGLGALRADGGTERPWWLRSPLQNTMLTATARISTRGKVDYSHVNQKASTARPALNLDTKAILFTSAAEGGKDGILGTLAPVQTCASQAWKLTLADDSRKAFQASLSDGVLTYSGAKTGEHEFISAVVLDSTGAVTHYGKIARAEAAGTVPFAVPADLEGKTLAFFNEQDNGDQKTDYASPLVVVDVPNGPDVPDVPEPHVPSVHPAVTPKPQQQKPHFLDVSTQDYFFDAVQWAVQSDITQGMTERTFAPEGACTRAQAVTFLWRAAGKPVPGSQTMPFTDVAPDAYYHDAVLWAVEQGIAMGTSADTFGPDLVCSRAHIVTFLWRMSGKPETAQTASFADVTADAYYAPAVLWAVNRGITTGTGNETFSPDSTCTRAQIVTFLYRNAT